MPVIRTLDDITLQPIVSSGGSNDILPWLVNVDVFMTAITQINWSTISMNGNCLYGANIQSTSAQNAEINFDVVLTAGTWTFQLIHVMNNNNGIYTILLDGTAIGTVNGYASTLTYNSRSTVSGVAVAITGKKRLTLRMATKDASSTSYYGIIQHIQFHRTA